ncbi:MAG TPA: hypothetical protein PKE04_04650, partial [Clostridia bacterium]|nr:hypothetical protein [Clostridia bacterium]
MAGSAVYDAYFERGTSRTFAVFAEASGTYDLRIAGGTGESDIEVNGLPQGAASLAGGGFPVALRKGINTLRFADGLTVEEVELIGAGQPQAVGASVPFHAY